MKYKVSSSACLQGVFWSRTVCRHGGRQGICVHNSKAGFVQVLRFIETLHSHLLPAPQEGPLTYAQSHSPRGGWGTSRLRPPSCEGVLGWPVGLARNSLGVALQVPGSGRQGAAEHECSGAGQWCSPGEQGWEGVKGQPVGLLGVAWQMPGEVYGLGRQELRSGIWLEWDTARVLRDRV